MHAECAEVALDPGERVECAKVRLLPLRLSRIIERANSRGEVADQRHFAARKHPVAQGSQIKPLIRRATNRIVEIEAVDIDGCGWSLLHLGASIQRGDLYGPPDPAAEADWGCTPLSADRACLVNG